MKQINASHLKERVTCLKKIFHITSEGEYEESWSEGEQSWAMVKPISSHAQNHNDKWYKNEGKKAENLYQVAMRKNVDRNALHAELDALLWKDKILNILFPFRPSSTKGIMETVFVDYGKGK